MIEIARLDSDRQVNVGNALGLILAAPRPTPLHQTTQNRIDAVIAATLGLAAARNVTPKQVDLTTDTMITSFDHTLEGTEQMLRDSVVPLGDAQREALGHIRTLRARLFPQGTGYIRKPMDLQWVHLSELRARIGEPAIAAAVDALGLRPMVDHLLAHIDLYGRALGQDVGAAGHAREAASAAWQEAFRRLAAQVIVDYEADEATQRELMAPYLTQLEQQRAAARASARARKARAEAEDQAPLSSHGGASPTGS